MRRLKVRQENEEPLRKTNKESSVHLGTYFLGNSSHSVGRWNETAQ